MVTFEERCQETKEELGLRNKWNAVGSEGGEMSDSSKYRVWYDNWDAQVEPTSQAEAADEVESEMHAASQAMLVTRGDLNKVETLKVIDSLRELVVASMKEEEK